jgi:hypothetical protein
LSQATPLASPGRHKEKRRRARLHAGKVSRGGSPQQGSLGPPALARIVLCRLHGVNEKELHLTTLPVSRRNDRNGIALRRGLR